MPLLYLHWVKLRVIPIITGSNGLLYIFIRNNKNSKCIQYIFPNSLSGTASSFNLVVLPQKIYTFHVYVSHYKTCNVYHFVNILFSITPKYELSKRLGDKSI